MDKRVPNNDLEAVTALLAKYMTAVNARAVVARALRENGLGGSRVTRRDLWKCNTTLRHGIGLFVQSAQQQAALAELSQFFGQEPLGQESCSVAIRTESDVGTARSEARRLCDRAGTDAFTMQKITTIVSELARNIVLYAQRGTIEMRPSEGGRRRLLIRAVDEGPGIPNLDHILSGSYKSKTGLGRGLLGTKRLADRFDVSTGSGGTSIAVEVTL